MEKITECPCGHEFGLECDLKDDCNKCDNYTWEACCDRWFKLIDEKAKEE